MPPVAQRAVRRPPLADRIAVQRCKFVFGHNGVLQGNMRRREASRPTTLVARKTAEAGLLPRCALYALLDQHSLRAPKAPGENRPAGPRWQQADHWMQWGAKGCAASPRSVRFPLHLKIGWLQRVRCRAVQTPA
jgi:hypothetical protein